MIPLHLHTVWLGVGKIPGSRDWLPSGWNHYLWNEDTVYQLGLEPWQYQHATLAGSSNIIRLHALRKLGGVYLDTDFDMLRPNMLTALCELSAWVCRQPDGVLCNAAFGAEPAHPWIQAMLDFYGDHQKQDAARGCHVMEPCLTPDVFVLPSAYFYPYNFDQPPAPPEERTIAIHRWAGSWLTNAEAEQP